MLSLRCPPDYRLLEAAADRLTDADGSSLPPNRRQDPRRPIRGAVEAGIIPGDCERLTLGRIPVSVFKPVWAGWGVDLAVSGVGLVADRRVPQAQRWWLRLDAFTTRPTILPAFVAGCRPLAAEEAGPDASPLFRVRFKFQVQHKNLARRLKLDTFGADQRVGEGAELLGAVAA